MNGVRIDDPNFGTSRAQTNENAVMSSITGDGTTNSYYNKWYTKILKQMILL